MKKMRTVKYFILVSTLIILGMISSCFLQKIAENTKHIAEGVGTMIKGSLGMGYAHVESGMTGGSGVDQIWAVPLKIAKGTTSVNGIFGEYTSPTDYVTYYKVFEVRERDLTGRSKFVVDVDSLKGQVVQTEVFAGDWLLILMNSQKVGSINLDTITLDRFPQILESRKDSIVSFIGISEMTGVSGNPESLLRMPVEKIIPDSVIDLGGVNMSADGSEARSSSTIDQNSSLINIPVSAIKETAVVDTIFKSVKNLFINKISCGVHYFWNGSADFSLLDSSAGRSPEELIFSGSQLTFHYYMGDWAELIDGVTEIGLEVPGEVVMTTNGGFVEDDSGSLVTYGTGERISLLSDPINGLVFEGKMKNIIPAGWFRLMKGGTAYAYYDLALMNPFVGNTTRYASVYMPVLQVITTPAGSDKLITGIKISWYLYNSTTGSYKELTDLTGLYEAVDNTPSPGGTNEYNVPDDADFTVSFSLTNTDANPYKVNLKGISERTLQLETDWYLPTDPLNGGITKYAKLIKLEYNYAGFNFQFYWCSGCGS